MVSELSFYFYWLPCASSLCNSERVQTSIVCSPNVYTSEQYKPYVLVCMWLTCVLEHLSELVCASVGCCCCCHWSCRCSYYCRRYTHTHTLTWEALSPNGEHNCHNWIRRVLLTNTFLSSSTTTVSRNMSRTHTHTRVYWYNLTCNCWPAMTADCDLATD